MDNTDVIKFKIPNYLKIKMEISDDFWFKYECVDVKKIPSDVLSIPYLFNIAPVVWLSGLSVDFESVDEDVLNSLTGLKSVFQFMYPDFDWNGEMKFSNVTKNHSKEKTDSCITLFSGGLDSVTTSIQNINTKQHLLSICGADIDLFDNKGWELVKSDTVTHSKIINGDCWFVSSNFKQIFNDSTVLNNNGEIKNWWANVQHGMALISFMAIPSYLTGSKVGLIASSSPKDFATAKWGSIPEIDNKVKWSGFSVLHDCQAMTRQDKANFIVNSVKSKVVDYPKLRVCYSSHGGRNCCMCEKCSRTITSLLVQGEDPNHYGFNVNIDRFILSTKIKLSLSIFDYKSYLWLDIVRKVETSSNSYFVWLSNFDFEKRNNGILMKFRRNAAKNTIAKQLYKIIKRFL